jgi:hypothetical protein
MGEGDPGYFAPKRRLLAVPVLAILVFRARPTPHAAQRFIVRERHDGGDPLALLQRQDSASIPDTDADADARWETFAIETSSSAVICPRIWGRRPAERG